MKNLSPNKQKEMEYLKDRSFLIIDFIIKKSNDIFSVKFKSIIQECYESSNLKGMKQLSRDLTAWVKGLPKNDILELEKLLIENLGENLLVDTMTIQIIKRVIKKNKIETNEEYRVISDYVKDVTEDDIFYKNLSQLNSILTLKEVKNS